MTGKSIGLLTSNCLIYVTIKPGFDMLQAKGAVTIATCVRSYLVHVVTECIKN